MASNVWQVEEHEESCGSSNLQVTMLASEWGSSKGGLSTINRELAIQLAKFSYVEVTFFLPKCSDEDKKAAASHGISIVEAKKRPGYRDELDWLSSPPGDLKMHLVVGHGVKLGRQAQFIRDSHKCKWVQIVHTDPEELGMFKGYENPILTGEQKHHEEVELCKMADFVVAVGPKLAEAYRRYLRSSSKDVLEFTPGVFTDFSSVQQVPIKGKQCNVLVFGRGDAEDFELKGFDIAAKSVAALSDTCLYFVGVPPGKHQQIANHFVNLGIPANRLKVRGYLNSREDLKQLFYEVDLVLMPSRTEGFGLTGLEALSAGLPVIVSKNSGFGEALGSVPFGSYFVVDCEDPSAWRKAIKVLWDKDRKQQLKEVKNLRGSYGEEYSWSKQCKSLIEKMFKLVDGNSSEPVTKAKGVETREGKRKKTVPSSGVPPKRKKGTKRNETAQRAGPSSGVDPPKRKKGTKENETAQPADLDESASFKPGTISQDDVLLIAHELGSSWEMVGRVLKVPDAVIDQIEAGTDKVSKKCYRVLRRWQQIYPSNATYHRLARALKHPAVGRVDLADKYCGLQLGKDVALASDEEEEEEEYQQQEVLSDYL
ncbi:PREDICTED: uncharacterized protein LOC107339308 isoform X11 [Acropora digitifera]|uniref:uncharacterized protein LOC107339308 isoform X11 n=1 Tax=Acropora digitifera TaxID=70779 RepID=UPI00077A11A1|nr:PREDICTED: uncharacterized protein LOC107339308 isoform X11 [Acropora digitifera]